MRSSTDGPALAPPLDRHVSSRALKAMGLTALMLVVVFMQIPSLFSLDPSSPFRSAEVPNSDKFEHMFATKTKYWDQRNVEAINSVAILTRAMLPLRALKISADQTPLREDLKLIQTQIVARHGVRYPTGGNINEINALLDKLKPFEGLLPTWMRNYSLPYNLSVQGQLAETGKLELRKLGVRSLARSGYDEGAVYSKEKYRVTHTQVARTRDSAIAFAKAFFGNAEDVEFIERPKNKDILLRFFDVCPRYQREVKKNQTAQEQVHEFQRSSTVARTAQWLTQSLGLKEENITFSAKNLMAVQSACAFDIAIYHHKHHWCSLMSMTFIHALDYLDDLEQFYWTGAGYQINYEMAAVLLREVFATMTARATGDSTLLGSFFFAHAETTIPLMTLMGYGDRTPLLANATEDGIASRGFRSSTLSPFAANIEFRLFKRKSSDEEFYVQILVNEKEAAIPGCGRVYCKLSELEQQWLYYLKVYDFYKDCIDGIQRRLFERRGNVLAGRNS
ncbi:hypothetical protein PF008_g9697 [Phytophthora fragariae]|uniref:Multiple inositol polyphosphate phosphatase 1 n=1 Tax=Phytophthora fragariae TaxID=53985 RepID=A0A6G0RW26_9STRA|nr:hypothetical protein PF008_g9697 [Phytophthora fragariae]